MEAREDHLSRKDFETALIVYDQLLEEFPDFAEGKVMREVCLERWTSHVAEEATRWAANEARVKEINDRIDALVNSQEEGEGRWRKLLEGRQYESQFNYPKALAVYDQVVKDFPGFVEGKVMQLLCEKRFRWNVTEMERGLEREIIRAANVDMEASYRRDREYASRIQQRTYKETGQVVEASIPQRQYGTMESVLKKLKEDYLRLKRKRIIEFKFSDAFFDPEDDTERKRVKRDYEAFLHTTLCGFTGQTPS
mmetsp:Transcript_9044/g.15160  ORF Transcript_9044/g.15160 Transcript_9044/m.15160 type:complete len:252 (-) Transcript_9044:180-935(-)